MTSLQPNDTLALLNFTATTVATLEAGRDATAAAGSSLILVVLAVVALTCSILMFVALHCCGKPSRPITSFHVVCFASCWCTCAWMLVHVASVVLTALSTSSATGALRCLDTASFHCSFIFCAAVTLPFGWMHIDTNMHAHHTPETQRKAVKIIAV